MLGDVSFRALLAVGIGGGLGSTLRYLVSVTMTRNSDSGLPWATLVVNLAGAALIGGIAQWSRSRGISLALSLGLTTGFLGGLTTFSTFCAESLQLAQAGRWTPFFAYTLGSVAAGIAGVALGTKFAQILLSGSPEA